MDRILPITVMVLAMLIAASHAQVVDDFSEGGWTRFASTPGKMSVDTGRMRLVDEPGPPDWITASKTFTVDVDKTPLFVVKVLAASDRGTVKLIRKDPYDKRVAIELDRPGLYAVDLRRRFGWQGVTRVETCLYANGDEEDITYEYVRYTDRLTPTEEDLIKNRAAGGNVRLDVSPFEVIPLFNACSFYFKSPSRPGLAVEYRGKAFG